MMSRFVHAIFKIWQEFYDLFWPTDLRNDHT